MNIKAAVVVIGMFVAASSYVIYQRITLTDAGYCFAENRYLDKQELIDNAISHLIKSYKPNEYSSITNKQGRIPSSSRFDKDYQTIDEFKNVNPDCCRIVPKEVLRPEDSDFWDYADRESGVFRYLMDRKTIRDMVEIKFVRGEYEDYDRDSELVEQNIPVTWNVIMKEKKHLFPMTNCGKKISID